MIPGHPFGLVLSADPGRDPIEGVAHEKRASALGNYQIPQNMPGNTSLEYGETQGVVITDSFLYCRDSQVWSRTRYYLGACLDHSPELLRQNVQFIKISR